MRRSPMLLLTLPLLLGLAACGSDDSPAMPTAPPVDTAPPVAPTGMTASTQGYNLVKIAWEPNVTDPDLVGYRLTRTGLGMTVVLMDSPQLVERFVDDHPFSGLSTYAVTAVDDAGNESPVVVVVHDYNCVRPPNRAIEF